MQREPRCAGAVAAALLACAALAAAGCGQEEPVRVGFAGALTGRGADLGISGRNGATLAVELRNEAGGLEGRPVELLVRDDGQSPEAALRVDRELMDLGAVAIVGHMTSAMSVAAVPLADERRVPLVSPTTTTTQLTGRDDFFFRVTATTREYATRMGTHLAADRKLRAVAVALDLGNAAYTRSWLEDFRRALEGGGGRVEREVTFTSGGETSFEDIARRLAAPGVDGVVLIANAMDGAMLCQQVRKLGATLPIAAAEWASTEKFLSFGGSAVEGVVVSQFFDRESDAPRYRDFRRRYQERFGEAPGFAAVAGFDAANVVMDAFRQRRRDEGVRDVIRRVRSFDGVQGPLVFDAFGDAPRAGTLAVVDGGTFRVLR